MTSTTLLTFAKLQKQKKKGTGNLKNCSPETKAKLNKNTIINFKVKINTLQSFR